MRRRLGVLVAAAVLGLGACGTAGDGGAGPDPDPPQETEAPASPAADDPAADDAADDGPDADDTCGDRLVNLHDPVPGRLFADCAADAVLAAGTSGYRTSGDDGSWAEGVVAWREPGSIALTNNHDMDVVVIGEQGWLLVPGEGWVVGDPAGTPPQVMAHSVISAIGQLTTVELQRALFASSPAWEPASGVTEVEGARAYSGTPDLMGTTPERYVVWLDDDHLPVRVEATLTLAGFTASTVDEFFDWGEPVEILPPEV
ncbi:hypothetical protein GXB85_08815 [Cellulomonas sp. APG4]|uniref:hypothetical protein n=1 Tax=Cellulomonas sp. APG4 TaxID=1538656 RepID=UPI00137A4882|nr:hypothetical protein [Cellulomonas sp. APG4]NCT91047.1 hypothetical protein [Cellulomonas sp. APG4]